MQTNEKAAADLGAKQILKNLSLLDLLDATTRCFREINGEKKVCIFHIFARLLRAGIFMKRNKTDLYHFLARELLGACCHIDK